MKIIHILLYITCISNNCKISIAWDNEELEVFDVVEEVDQNFYKLLNVPENANSSIIRKAFRTLSLQLHPDKNNAPDADIKFRNLVSVYDVLRDPNKRKHYDNVLANGLPNWRSATYYYRHVRKMELLEMSTILFIVITIGQYLVAWAAYFEKRYDCEQDLSIKLQKLQKKNRKNKMDIPDLIHVLDKIPSPSVFNTLPFQLPRWIVTLFVAIPSMIYSIKKIIEERKGGEETASLEKNEVPELELVPRGLRRRRPIFTPQEHNFQSSGETFDKKSDHNRKDNIDEKPKISGGLWTDDNILELIKNVKKYPGGTQDRWEKISNAMNRTVNEVVYMAKKIKDEGIKPEKITDNRIHIEAKKIKTRTNDSEKNYSEWSQEQQKTLESALIKYPKGGSVDRWEKISNCIKGKTKEECQLRYRELVEIVKKKQREYKE